MGIFVGIIGLVIGSILSGIALIQTSDLAQKGNELTKQANELANQSLALSQQALKLEAVSSNYEPAVIPYSVDANFGKYNYSGESYSYLEGNLTISLIIISPHACIVNYMLTILRCFSVRMRCTI